VLRFGSMSPPLIRSIVPTFVHASADDVLDEALNYVFSEDPDFQDFLKTPQAKQVGRANHCCTVLLLGVTRRWTCTSSPNSSAFRCF
jgi:hypothetical protein